MKIHMRVVLSLFALYLSVGTLAFAADDAYLYIVHGIPGRDISASLDPSFPIDILLNDDVCVERGTTFGVVVGPLTLPAGQSDIKISPANSFVPCSNSPLVETNVALKAGDDVSAIAALDDKGHPTILTFVNDFKSVAENNARIALTNAADAPELQIILELVGGRQKYTYNVNPGKTVVATLPSDPYNIEVESNGTVLVPLQPLTLPSLSTTLVYAVGTASNGSVTLVTKTVKDVL